jgi:hypothetical protein
MPPRVALLGGSPVSVTPSASHGMPRPAHGVSTTSRCRLRRGGGLDRFTVLVVPSTPAAALDRATVTAAGRD